MSDNHEFLNVFSKVETQSDVWGDFLKHSKYKKPVLSQKCGSWTRPPTPSTTGVHLEEWSIIFPIFSTLNLTVRLH